MSDTKVAFTASAEYGGNVGPFDQDTTLVFNKVITNVGGAYDPTSGEFTAPVAGVYCFTFSYHAEGKKPSGLSLMKKGSVVVKAFDKSVTDPTDNAGNSAVLDLQPGDKVFVQLPAHCCVYAAERATTFSGFLICET